MVAIDLVKRFVVGRSAVEVQRKYIPKGVLQPSKTTKIRKSSTVDSREKQALDNDREVIYIHMLYA